MAVDQLPGKVREFANHLNGLVARLDQAAGWCAVFWQRDPDGMQACLDGREMPPWDVIDALLQDLAAAYGPRAAAQEEERVRALHAAALVDYDARPGARDALGDRLDVMLREQRYAAERQAELGRLLATAATREEADALRLDLAWAHDDHERATARCAELRSRMAESDRRANEASGGDRGRGARGTGFPQQRGPHEPGRGDPAQARITDPHPTDDWPAGDESARDGSTRRWSAGGEPIQGRSAHDWPAGEEAGRGQSAHGWPAEDESARDGSTRGWPAVGEPVQGRSAHDWPAGDESVQGQPTHGWPAEGDRAQDNRAQDQGARDWAVGDESAPGGLARGWPAEGDRAQDRPAHDWPAEGQPAHEWPAPGRPASDDPFPGQPAPADLAPADPPSSEPPPAEPAPPAQKQRRRRRGGARFAGMAEADGGSGAVPADDQSNPQVTGATGRKAPRGARFAGAGAGKAPQARSEPSEDGVSREVGEVVARLVRLRAEGRTGEAHALLVEAANWPAARFPALAVELHRAGLGADWATLLWEAASLPADRLVAAADALVAAGRDADGEQMLRQGVARPADEVGQAVLELVARGHRREVRALLDAYVRVRTPEEAARSAEPDPQVIAPLLLEAARGVSEGRHWDLVHALRVAGLSP